MLKVTLPVVVLLLGIIGAYTLLATRPVLQAEIQAGKIPTVTVIEVKPETVRLNVHSQGVVKPRQELDLTAEVAGKIIFLHPNFVTGGYFNEGELLVRIDARDYDAAIVQAQAQIAEAKRLLATELAQADQARTEWQTLGTGKPTALVLREPQLAEARAKLQAANSLLEQAHIRRSRCELHALFSGRFASKAVTTGQVIQSGEKLARLYATDIVEIRLPIALDQLAMLDLSLNQQQHSVLVTLSATVGGALQTWEARIVRTEGMIDENTGVLYLVAEVQQQNQVPLLNGLFVEADIQGKELNNVFVLPPQAINTVQEVLTVDKNQHLHIRRLEVLRTEANRVLIQNGLQAGERIIISGIDLPIEGMTVQVDGRQ